MLPVSCVDGVQVRSLSLADGTFTVVLPADAGTRPPPIKAVLRLPSGRVGGLCGGFMLAVDAKGVGTFRRSGHILLSPSQSQILALTDRGPETVPLNLI